MSLDLEAGRKYKRAKCQLSGNPPSKQGGLWGQ